MIVLDFVDDLSHERCCRVRENEPMPVDENGTMDEAAIKAIMDCKLIDYLDMGHGVLALIDDEGLYRDPIEYNWPATALRTVHWLHNKDMIACPVNYPPLIGTVVLVGDGGEGKPPVDLNADQIKYLKTILG